MIDYTSMDETELNRLAGEFMGWEHYINSIPCGINEFRKSGVTVLISPEDWRPTKDANQLQDYLFKELIFNECHINEESDPCDGYIIEIIHSAEAISVESTGDYAQINRTKVIACLRAQHILNEGKSDDS